MAKGLSFRAYAIGRRPRYANAFGAAEPIGRRPRYAMKQSFRQRRSQKSFKSLPARKRISKPRLTVWLIV
ncbi:hypothetical protein [Moorena sp. SIO3H5]|uniref:hypothetical protein n=1 Tax=Moorena sp. SIO3H5 TaxID=2607834 RepID=UPI0013B5BD0C|nr:hypothetical protein [Moorena sp. SIO3H5]NEO70479.1 hypothetical protein [Moorena sp. SIO3H5]